ncbi:hypothetical protein [Paragemmobacter aquarius]|nr:hypothetical protein [Gemmobacter aquarius]
MTSLAERKLLTIGHFLSGTLWSRIDAAKLRLPKSRRIEVLRQGF